MKYEIALVTKEENSKWRVTDDELKHFIWVLYKLGHSAYRGYNDEICFSLHEDEVTKIGDEQ